MAAGPGGRNRLALPMMGAMMMMMMMTPLPAASPEPCRHRVPPPAEVLYQVPVGAERVSRRAAGAQRMRIRVVYDGSVQQLLLEKRRLIQKELFPQAVAYLEATFEVRRPTGTILLSRQCANDEYLRKRGDPHRYCRGACARLTRCGPVTVPEGHLQQCRACSEGEWQCGPSGPPDGQGIRDADFVLYVSARTTARCVRQTVIAYAAYCQQEAHTDRPVAGYANLCPAAISARPQEFEGLLSTVKHEVVHALGFSAGLFAFYYDDAGQPLTPRYANGLPPFNRSLGLYQWSERVARGAERLWHVRGQKVLRHRVTLLVTPRVVAEARAHFACPSLEGLELENQGGPGTELNHWEKRLLENEAMTGSHTRNRVMSRLTLALMEDTGWYRANYSMAQRLDWGRGQGCHFATKSCKFWMDHQRQRGLAPGPFCDVLRGDPLQLTCRQDRTAVAVCNLQRFGRPLPPEYQYFDQLSGVPAADLAHHGGSVAIADYCPFGQEFSWRASGDVQRSSDCRLPENQPEPAKNLGVEKYGPHSACLLQESPFVMERCEQSLSYPDWGSGCYQVTCSPSGLDVWVQDSVYPCSRAGQVLPVSAQADGWVHGGSLLCPSCQDFCDRCPPERDPSPLINFTRTSPLDLCSCSSSPVATLRLLVANLLPPLAGFLLCAWR
ncbi:leishmanolysin-like peptidase [Tachyglossus aculeatus]|uniref:leishmanolysin-like peptidase n=1 Tax=Tachyglossus aculeatus TaxID=9261 RepID=UPI0018F7B35F|nr:leishmanolysin-like peptidase [Tachyglossus aculeatus]